MRFTLCVLSILCFFVTEVQAQDRPLYNGSSVGGSTLYNGTTSGGVKPLSLRQIVEGRNETGSSGYSYRGTGYTPYTSGTSTSSGIATMSEVDAWRAEQAAISMQREKEAHESVLSYNTDNNQEEETQAYLNEFHGGGQTAVRQSGKKKRVLYRGRKQNIETPRRIFNSVR